MSGISVLGLGLMGSALASALQHDGHSLTVWNRASDTGSGEQDMTALVKVLRGS